jgi:hypothetical protein
MGSPIATDDRHYGSATLGRDRSWHARGDQHVDLAPKLIGPSAGSRSIRPSAQRSSMTRFWPSTQPSPRRRAQNAATARLVGEGDCGRTKPTRTTPGAGSAARVCADPDIAAAATRTRKAEHVPPSRRVRMRASGDPAVCEAMPVRSMDPFAKRYCPSYVALMSNAESQLSDTTTRYPSTAHSIPPQYPAMTSPFLG